MTKIEEVLSFYSAMNRPLTALEIWRLTAVNVDSFKIHQLIKKLLADTKIKNKNGFFSFKIPIDRRRQDLLLDKKWKKFLSLRRWFNFIPFIDFVFGAGSLALGTVHATSDFDVLIGCRAGRIFTVRFMSIVVFGLLGIRRKRFDRQAAASDKICLNHFVTPTGYQLEPPYNPYWQNLYKNLVPVWGKIEAMRNFLNANPTIAGYNFSLNDQRWRPVSFNFIRELLVFILKGAFGNFIERILKKIQIIRIKNNFQKEKISCDRLICNDKTLEFHWLWRMNPPF